MSARYELGADGVLRGYNVDDDLVYEDGHLSVIVCTCTPTMRAERRRCEGCITDDQDRRAENARLINPNRVHEYRMFIPLPADIQQLERAQQVMRRLLEGPTAAERETQAEQLAEQRRAHEAKSSEGLAAWVVELARHPSGSLAREIVTLHRPVYVDDHGQTPHLECRGCHPWMYEDDENELGQIGVTWPCATFTTVQAWQP